MGHREEIEHMWWKNIWRACFSWVASGFGSGYARVAPGTCGSAAALIFWWILCRIDVLGSGVSPVALVVITTAIGLLAVACVVGVVPATSDPQWIVIDEWAGLYVALFGIAPGEWGMALVAFVLFRFFDATKIGPVGWVEALPGALGIMADDLVAGACTALVIWALRAAM